MNNKLNFYITAGLTLGIFREGQGYHNITSIYNNNTQNESGTTGPSYGFQMGGFVSGRISYKISRKLNVFVESAALSDWTDNTFSNYHINGGVSLNL